MLIVENLGQQRLPARQVAAVLGRAGVSARLAALDSIAGVPEVVALALDTRPSLVVCSLLFADRASEFELLLQALAGAGITAHRTCIGHLPSLAPSAFLAAWPALDSVLCGEPEAAIVQLALAAKTGLLRGIPGLVERQNGEGENAMAAPLADLDSLPFPIHPEPIPSRRGYGFATIKASRGCYHHCTFCLPAAFYRRNGPCYRRRSIGNFVDEIEQIYRRGGRLFLFDDEQFLPPPSGSTVSSRSSPWPRADFVDGFARELARRRLTIAFTIKCRADDVDISLFRRLKRAGLIRVYLGIESGSPSTLRYLGKGTSPDQNALALRRLSALGITADWGALLFHPAATLETLDGDLKFMSSVVDWMPTLLTFHDVEVYAGTPLGASVARESHGSAYLPGRESSAFVQKYLCLDPRLEIVRRIVRLVFGPGTRHDRLSTRLTEAWFDLLLQKRFDPSREDAVRAQALSAAAREANRVALQAVGQMLEWANRVDPGAVEEVNSRAAGWACRVDADLEPISELLNRF